MHANVREWCWDVYDPKAYDSRPGVTRDPVVSSGGDRRVNRGGCWYLPRVHARSADRFEFTPDGAFHDFGFRVVKPVGR